MLLSYTTQNILLVNKELINTANSDSNNKKELYNPVGNGIISHNKDTATTRNRKNSGCVLLTLGKWFAPQCLPSKEEGNKGADMSRSKFWVRKVTPRPHLQLLRNRQLQRFFQNKNILVISIHNMQVTHQLVCVSFVTGELQTVGRRKGGECSVWRVPQESKISKAISNRFVNISC